MAGTAMPADLNIPALWHVRAMAEADAEDVAALAQLLALQENTPPSLFDAVALRRDGLGSERHFNCVVIEHPEKSGIVGMVIYYPGYDVATATRGTHLADIYVQESCRKKGAGCTLMGYVARETLAQGGHWMSWTVTSHNHAARDFYSRLNAHNVDVHFMAIGKKGLVQLAENRKGGS